MADPTANVSIAHTTSHISQQDTAAASALSHDAAGIVNQNPAGNPIVRKAVEELRRRRLAAQYRQRAVGNEEYQRLWREDILTHHVNHPAAPLWECFLRLDKSVALIDGDSIETLSEYLSSDIQPWRSRAYKVAYPRLAQFLKAANLPLEPTDRCEVHFADFRSSAHAICLHEWLSTEDATPDKYNIPRRRRNPEKLLDHGKLWTCIRSRSRPLEQRIFYTHQTGTQTVQVQDLVPCRTLRIVDLTPTTAVLILASAPRLDLSYVSSFFERYLKFSNWGRVNLISKVGDSKLKTYFLEYHFSFYHVPDVKSSFNSRTKDVRDLRNVSPFHAGSRDGARSIYEEQLSFLLVGHGGDVYTNIQLAEKYYVKVLEDDDQNVPNLMRPRGEEGDLSKRMPLFIGRGKPCATFLAWMCSSLLHVIARWQATIEAVESEIHTSVGIPNGQGQNTREYLLSDDSSFSRSRRYLWAIQVYKIFEQKLEETLTVWKEFENHSLLKLYDPHVPHRDDSLETITRAVTSLEAKLAHVIRRRGEITNLRDGLFATSQLLDSRLSVLQNDNIRLLTYVNLLFLPLAFCTSIFGMATVLPPSVGMHTFVITIISVTIFTAFLVLNLQLLTELTKQLMGRFTILLRKLMQSHWRPSWRKTNSALQNDVDAAKIPIQNRLRRSSHWMYLIFIIETLLVGIPVYEFRAATNLWGLISHLDMKAAASKARRPIFSRGRQVDTDPQAYEKQRRAEILERRRRRWKQTRQILITILRIVFLPIWAALVFLELTFLFIWFSLPTIFLPISKRKGNSNHWWPSGPWRRALRLLGLSKDRGTPSGPITFPPKIRQTLDKWRSKSQDTVAQTKAAKKAQAHNQRTLAQHDPQAELTQEAHVGPRRDLEQGI